MTQSTLALVLVARRRVFTNRDWARLRRRVQLSDDNHDSVNQEDIEEIEEEPEEDPAVVIFENGKGIVSSEDADRLSQQGFYGTRIDGNKLELEPVELLHLISGRQQFRKTDRAMQMSRAFRFLVGKKAISLLFHCRIHKSPKENVNSVSFIFIFRQYQ